MIYLAIETSDPRGSLALFDNDGVRQEDTFSSDMAHAREFADRIDNLLRQGGFAAGDLGGISVSIGPGSYTGCRVGVTAAKTLAIALRIPVVALSSLEVMAAFAMESPGSRREAGGGAVDSFIPVLDGRRGFFYGAHFRRCEGNRPRRTAAAQVAPAWKALEILRNEGKLEEALRIIESWPESGFTEDDRVRFLAGRQQL